MSHKYSELVKPLDYSSHSPAQLTDVNSEYQKSTEDSEQIYHNSEQSAVS